MKSSQSPFNIATENYPGKDISSYKEIDIAELLVKKTDRVSGRKMLDVCTCEKRGGKTIIGDREPHSG